MDNVFEEISVRKVSEQIVEQIKKLISEGKLEPGQKMPSERELAERLGVGRSSLREALNTLAAQGLVEIRKRQGVFLKTVSSSLTFEPLKEYLRHNGDKLPQLYEIRHDLELASAFLASRRRTNKDLEAIRATIDTLKQTPVRSLQWWEHDCNFHLAVARATHNVLRVHILKDLFALSQELAEELVSSFARDRNNLATLIEQHEAIYDAIASQDEDRARQVMNEHLDLACSLIQPRPDSDLS